MCVCVCVFVHFRQQTLNGYSKGIALSLLRFWHRLFSQRQAAICSSKFPRCERLLTVCTQYPWSQSQNGSVCWYISCVSVGCLSLLPGSRWQRCTVVFERRMYEAGLNLVTTRAVADTMLVPTQVGPTVRPYIAEREHWRALHGYVQRVFISTSSSVNVYCVTGDFITEDTCQQVWRCS